MGHDGGVWSPELQAAMAVGMAELVEQMDAIAVVLAAELGVTEAEARARAITHLGGFARSAVRAAAVEAGVSAEALAAVSAWTTDVLAECWGGDG